MYKFRIISNWSRSK